jgi:hypothetical protein
MACLRLKPTSDALLPQGLPAKIIRLHRSGRQAKAHISMKPDNFRRQIPELAGGRCAFSGACLDMPPQMGTRSWLCGVFLYELVPSGDPFICCLCETFCVCVFLLQRIFFTSSENKLTSQQGLQLLPCKASSIRTSTSALSTYTTYYQPVEFTSFCLACSLCCFCF